ncbi:protein-export chaperone SecB [Balneatrix alpica]|uniref:Protein-export protein SecB n=1 Tax=Balneatrix alpica TaxID=75684 RepID=A0ABV5ZCD0_9GAMM|nr:protein-export chaperone SecB [Balneatrix alpica]
MADEQQKQQPQFALQRLYLKDVSYEAPGVPLVFTKPWEPKVQLDLNAGANHIAEGLYEVVVQVTVTVKNGDDTAFLVEVQQAGLFIARGIEGDALDHTLNAFCPNILFPYAREAVDNLVTKGGFPPLMLAPVNFDALYAEQKAAKQQAQ